MPDRKTLALAAALAFAGGAASANDDHGRATLAGAQEVPAISTGASAAFTARLVGTKVNWELNYRDLESDATQAHIHFGQRSVNGGIAVFLCSNLGNGPVGTQVCPLRAGSLSGSFGAESVIGPTGQGIAAGEFAELVRALRRELTYANIHTTQFPAGEVRGQIRFAD